MSNQDLTNPPDYEDAMLNVDNLNTDIKINPDFYVHRALVLAQNCFLKENAEMGFTQYLIFIDHIENLCRAAEIIPEDYEQKVKEFEASPEMKATEKPLLRLVKIANKKLYYLMREVFGRKAIRGSILIRPK